MWFEQLKSIRLVDCTAPSDVLKSPEQGDAVGTSDMLTTLPDNFEHVAELSASHNRVALLRTLTHSRLSIVFTNKRTGELAVQPWDSFSFVTVGAASFKTLVAAELVLPPMTASPHEADQCTQAFVPRILIWSRRTGTFQLVDINLQVSSTCPDQRLPEAVPISGKNFPYCYIQTEFHSLSSL
jgi:hypothetical protein